MADKSFRMLYQILMATIRIYTAPTRALTICAKKSYNSLLKSLLTGFNLKRLIITLVILETYMFVTPAQIRHFMVSGISHNSISQSCYYTFSLEVKYIYRLSKRLVLIFFGAGGYVNLAFREFSSSYLSVMFPSSPKYALRWRVQISGALTT